MTAEELISDQIIPLKCGDLCDAAISFMHDAKVVEMPVVESGKLLGYLHISKAEKTQNKTVGQVMENKLLFIPANTHLFDITRIMYDTNSTTIAVCDDQQNYIGAVSLADLLKAYSKNTANSLPGAIITLEMFPRDYSLTEIARISESNDFKITGLFISNIENNKLLNKSKNFEEGNIVIVKGLKKDDCIFADLVAIQDHEIYMKLNDLKKIDKNN